MHTESPITGRSIDGRPTAAPHSYLKRLQASKQAPEVFAGLSKKASNTLLIRLAKQTAATKTEPSGRVLNASSGKWQGSSNAAANEEAEKESTRPAARANTAATAAPEYASAIQPRGAKLNELRRHRITEPLVPINKTERGTSLQTTLASRAARLIRQPYDAKALLDERVGAVLIQQWSSPIDGPIAPTHLLNRSVGSTPLVAAGHDRDRPPQSPSNAAAQKATVEYRSSDAAPGEQNQSFRTRSISSDALLASTGKDQQTLADDWANSGSSQHTALQPTFTPQPASAADQMPGLAILPISALSAGNGTRPEATMAEDDLDALAAKIKLILDEQARRHGIDV